MGHDWGAALAWFLATIAPDRVTKMVRRLAPDKKWCIVCRLLHPILDAANQLRSGADLSRSFFRNLGARRSPAAQVQLVHGLSSFLKVLLQYDPVEYNMSLRHPLVRTTLIFSIWIFTELRGVFKFYLSAYHLFTMELLNSIVLNTEYQ